MNKVGEPEELNSQFKFSYTNCKVGYSPYDCKGNILNTSQLYNRQETRKEKEIK